MKGVVFNEFNELVEEKFGLEMWQKLLDKVKPESGGLYTSANTYKDEELFGLVAALSEETKVAVPDLVKTFGEHLAGKLTGLYPNFVEGKSIKEFLLSIHDVVHVEVKKIHPDAGLPSFEYEDPGDNQLVMIYKSPRKLEKLAEGLILGTGKVYNTPIDLKITKSYEKGDDHCRFEMTFPT